MLFAYGSTEPLPTLGTFTANITSPSNDSQFSSDFVVIQGEGRTLLGQETAETLNLLRIGPLHVNSVVGECTAADIREEYKDLFRGVGLLKDYELKLHIDESVRPIAWNKYADCHSDCVRKQRRNWTSYYRQALLRKCQKGRPVGSPHWWWCRKEMEMFGCVWICAEPMRQLLESITRSQR